MLNKGDKKDKSEVKQLIVNKVVTLIIEHEQDWQQRHVLDACTLKNSLQG